MKPLFKLELNTFPSVHLSQIYDGLAKLRKLGIVEIIYKPKSCDATKPLLTVKINNKYTAIYDALDGFNWISGSIEQNLNYFRDNTNADFYFKRSYSKQLLEYAPQNCKVYPLGLNYPFLPENRFDRGLKETLKYFIKSNYLFSKYSGEKPLYSKDFEYYPIPNKENKVLFITQLWNPDDVSSSHLQRERNLINRNRINCIKACKREFGRSFFGGLKKDSFSVQHSKDLIIPDALTKKENYLAAIKDHNICIATTGLHSSIGWKFGEYVAASRAILTEPLNYDVPGSFHVDKNYSVFNNEDELLNKIQHLIDNKDVLFEMMNRNFHYYNSHLRSDLLVLNTLLTINQDI